MELTVDEHKNGALDAAKLDVVVRQLSMNGYATIERLYSPERVAELHGAYLRYFEPFVKDNKSTVHNGHFRMDLPFVSPFVDEDIISNPVIMQIVERLVGSDCICQYFASNTCMPGSELQQIHSDLHPLYPQANLSLPPVAIVANIALVDFHENNGPTQIWPGGTHLTPEYLNRPDYIQEAALNMPSMNITMPAGSVALRDLRMWHRGTRNHSDSPRPMIATVYFRHWFGAEPLEIPKATFDQFPEKVQRLFRKARIL